MRLREPIALGAYLAVINLLLPLGILVGLPLLLRQEKRRKTLLPRLGFQPLPTTERSARPVWVHALSLGETLSCVALVEELRRRLGDRPLYLSVSTAAAMQVAAERMGPHVDGMFYFPLDLWWPVRRMLRRISPGLVVFIETDIWPGVLRQLRRTRTPALLVNGRLSPRTYRTCSRFRSLFAPTLNTFERIYPQSVAERQRYLEVGVDPGRLATPGNLKFDVANRQPAPTEIADLRNRLGMREAEVVLLAGSTHAGEEESVMSAFLAVRRAHPPARLILVPRHPVRAGEVVELARRSLPHVQRYSTVDAAQPWEVLVVDVMGVLSRLYALASLSFVGGSLVRKGGQNPLESAAAGCPVFFGPDMSDFPDIARWLLEAGAARTVADGAELGARWIEVLQDEGARTAMREACRGVIAEHCGCTTAIAEEVSALISG